MEVDADLPYHVKYFLTTTSKNDCFFVLESESGQTQRIGAKKIFLCAHSEPLRHMLEDSELAEQNDVRVVDIEPVTFWTFLKCVYGGSDTVIPKLSFDDSVNLLYVLEKYLVNEIKPKVVSHTLQLLPLEFDNIFCAVSNPVCFTDIELEKAIINIIKCNVNEILSSEKILQINSEGLLQIVKMKSLNISETDVWDALVKWAKHITKSTDGEVLRMQILSHLKFIRVCTFTYEEFCEKVISTGILTYLEVVEICKYFSSGVAPQLKYICNSTFSRSESDILQKSYCYIIDNFEPVGTYRTFQKFTWNGFSWKCRVGKHENYLSAHLCCEGNSENTSWEIPVTVEMMFINQEDQSSRCYRHSVTFCKDKMSSGHDQICNLSDLTIKGPLKNNTITFMVHLKKY
ncbi:ubiquitin protein ligase binding [Homalodisca vitripennis]|nr:ubiquitin protein ligase binding [Homalodisca vitripennis]